EYIQVKDVQKEVLISPEMKRRPRFTVKGKSLIIEFEEKLDSATTYKIDFGNSIQDNNEGNPLVNFAYVFSTGPSIDSLAMSGQVIDAFTGDSILNALILLYDAKKDSLESDSVLYKSLPNSIARTDSMGVFIATNLKPINYKVYALQEEPTTGKYDKGADKVAFIDTLLNPSKLPPFDVWFNPLRLRIEASPQTQFRLFSESAPLKRQTLSKSSRPDKNTLQLEFAEKNPIISEFTLDSIDLDKVITKRTKYGDTITIFIPAALHIPDSIKGNITYASTTGDSIPKDTIITKKFVIGHREIKRKKKSNDTKEPNPFRISTESPQTLNPYEDIIFKFGYPLQIIDSSQITLKHIIEVKAKEERGARSGKPADAAKKTTKEATTNVQYENVTFSIVQDSIDIMKWRLKSNWIEAAK
ncbi:MAG: Ig-like domain-containing protein, partial [Rikenellaceae bacterium]